MLKKNKAFLNNQDWKFCVKNFPIISVDLIIKNKKSEILMGKRINNPAKNFYFVPGGRILKNESIDDAIERISLNELGHLYKRNDTKFINFFEHFYANSFWKNESFSTHYVVMAFLINCDEDDNFNLKNQHEDLKWFSKKDRRNIKIHKYSLHYLNL